jgi:hypothetical protein
MDRANYLSFRQVVVILQDGSTPIKYGLTMDMEDRCSVIPPKLARLCGVPPDSLVLVEIVQSQVSLPCLEQRFVGDIYIYIYVCVCVCVYNIDVNIYIYIYTYILRVSDPPDLNYGGEATWPERQLHLRLRVDPARFRWPAPAQPSHS